MLSVPNSRRHDGAPTSSRQVDEACQRVAAGKSAARELAHWAARVGVSETEFRLMWQLFAAGHTATPDGADLPDQSELAAALVVSPAQVSGAVERLRSLDLVERVASGADRRRQLWRLSERGRAVVHAVLHVIDRAARGEAA